MSHTFARQVTAVHKANIMKKADGLFLECCREAAALAPDIKYEEIIVDNACMQLVRDPTQVGRWGGRQSGFACTPTENQM